MPMSRKEATALARRICNEGEALAPRGAEVVVVVTDTAGEWVGVAATTPHRRTLAILDSALHGADYQSHAQVIDMETETDV